MNHSAHHQSMDSPECSSYLPVRPLYSVWPSIIVADCTIEVLFLLPNGFGIELSVHADGLTLP